jgi:hypothetical protein
LCRNALTSMNFIAQLNPSSYTGEPERPWNKVTLSDVNPLAAE